MMRTNFRIFAIFSGAILFSMVREWCAPSSCARAILMPSLAPARPGRLLRLFRRFALADFLYGIKNEKPSNTYSCFPSFATGFTSPRRTSWIAVTTLGR